MTKCRGVQVWITHNEILFVLPNNNTCMEQRNFQTPSTECMWTEGYNEKYIMGWMYSCGWPKLWSGHYQCGMDYKCSQTKILIKTNSYWNGRLITIFQSRHVEHIILQITFYINLMQKKSRKFYEVLNTNCEEPTRKFLSLSLI